jgi:hypothetical protein
MTQYGTWVSYGGAARIVLAIVLVAVAGGVAYAGTRLRIPVRPARPGSTARVFMLATWLLAIAVLLAGVFVDVQQIRREHLLHAPPVNPITPVTVIGVGVIFIVIALASSSHGWRVMLGSAVVGAMAAPMIFEFPFDLIVMARVYPPVPPHPALYLALFFAPLLVVEVTTLSLLTLSPMIRLSRPVFLFFALMLAVFAVWALFGFAYPSAPAPIALNVVSKILALAAGLSLFLPQRAAASTTSPAASPPAMDQFTSAGQPRRAGKSAGAVATGSRPVSP